MEDESDGTALDHPVTKGSEAGEPTLCCADRISGAERKARLLENEKQKIQGELQFWNEVY